MDLLAEKINSILPTKKIGIFGKDQLLKNTFPYYLLAFLCTISLFKSGENIFMFIFIVYTVLPLLDEFLSYDLRNPSQQQRKQLQKRDFQYKLILYITIITDWALFFKVLTKFAEMDLINPLGLVRNLAFIFIFSNLESVQFAVAHQVFHKPGIFHKYLGTIHMIKNLYMHFTYQHLYGHHRKVATPQDPASAPKGMNVYKFFIRSLIGSWKSVYQMQVGQNKSLYNNYAVLSLIASIIFTSLIFKAYGIKVGILYVISAVGSIFYLQAINYIEHYGLRRQRKADGTYQKVTIKHSWNAPHRFTNYLLFKLQRHSDHHQNSLKPYQTLLSLQQSPHLPHGYTVCIFMSFFPNIWYNIMDPLVDQYNRTKIGNINSEVMKRAIKETRKFIVKISIITTTMFACSLLY